MSPIDWDDIADNAQQATDNHFKNQISSLTSLNNEGVTELINETGIGRKDLVQLLKVIDDAASSNEEKARAIANIHKGVNVLVAVASKLLI
jgi:hypothetical protein